MDETFRKYCDGIGRRKKNEERFINMPDATEIVSSYYNMIYRIAWNYTKNRCDAEDICSETLMAYFTKQRVFENEEHRKAWLIRVAINNSKSLLRQRKYHQDIDIAMDFGDDILDNKATSMDIHNAIKQLKPEYSQIINLFYINDMSIKQISNLLNISENTIKIRLHRGRKILKTLLQS